MKGEKELSVVCIKVVVRGKGGNDRVLRGVVYMTKSTGSITEPWGTPQEEVYNQDEKVSYLTRKERDDKYDLN